MNSNNQYRYHLSLSVISVRPISVEIKLRALVFISKHTPPPDMIKDSGVPVPVCLLFEDLTSAYFNRSWRPTSDFLI